MARPRRVGGWRITKSVTGSELFQALADDLPLPINDHPRSWKSSLDLQLENVKNEVDELGHIIFNEQPRVGPTASC